MALTSFVDTVSGKLSPGHNRGSPLEAVRTCFPETVSIDTQRRYVRVSVLREVRPNRPVSPPLKFLVREPYKISLESVYCTLGRHRKVT